MLAAAKNVGIRLLYRLMLFRLRLESCVETWRIRSRKPRVLATACWTFPIYSQTFVYQELCELVRAGFNLRFLFTKLEDRRRLPAEFSCLWRLKRRVLLDKTTAVKDLEYYRRRMPAKVEALTQVLCEESGLSAETLTRHEHFLHAFSFARMVEAWRAEYLHSYFFYERTLFVFVASYLLGIPRGVSCYADHLLKDYELKLVPLHLKTCNLVLATSRRIKSELENICRAGEMPNIVVKPNAIDTLRYQQGERSDKKSGSPYRLVCTSRIDPKKGLLHLVDATRILLDRNLPVELHVVGAADEDQPASVAYARDLQERVHRLGLDSAIHMEGRKSSQEVRHYLERAHVFVAPFVELPNGDKDGIPTALLEAMASGCPIVATDAGSIPEVIENEVEGLLVPQGAALPLADAIARLISDEDLSTRLRRNAVERVRRQYDIRRCEAIFHGRIRKLVAMRREDENTVHGTGADATP